jgi:putative phosphoesterase
MDSTRTTITGAASTDMAADRAVRVVRQPLVAGTSARVAVVSDTHVPRFRRYLPDLLVTLETLRPDAILHCGDWTDPSLIEMLAAIAPTDGVAGNNDGPELHRRLGTHAIVTVAGARIAMTHGHLGPGRSTPDRALAAFAAEPDLGAIVFGHSHIPVVRELTNRAYLINPGSATDRRSQPSRTMASLEVEDSRIVSARIVALSGGGEIASER